MSVPSPLRTLGVLAPLLLVARGAFAAGAVVHASSAGAKLDADLLTGGGTDDTAVLQAVLDRAASGAPVQLIIDGAALVSGLNVYGSTSIVCTHGGGLYLKDGSSRAIVRNVHRSKRTITDEHITIRGCFLNGNRENQPSADIPRPDMPGICCTPSNREADGTFITGLQFLGVNDLTIENTTLWNIRAFGVLIANANRIAITNLTVDYGRPLEGIQANTDGLMFKGPLRYATVNGLKLRTGDDGLALNADTWPEDQGDLYGPYVGVGPITDVSITNVQFMDAPLAIRLLSAKERIDRIIISNLSGTIRGGPLAALDHYLNPSGHGNFGSIIFDNINVDRSNLEPAALAQWQRGLDEMESRGGRAKEVAEFFRSITDEGRGMPYFAINGHIENLSVRNLVTKIADERSIILLGGHAKVQTLMADLTLLDDKRQAVPLKLEQGSRIERLDFALRWSGGASDQGKSPIVSRGGTVGQMHLTGKDPL